MKLKIYLLLLLCFNYVGVFAQTPQQIEADLLKSYKQIDTVYFSSSDDTTGVMIDSLFGANSIFAGKLGEFAVKNPSTISFPFDSLRNAGLDIITSTDGRLRIYSWDTRTGGAQHSFSNIFQFKSGKRTDTLSDVLMGTNGTPEYVEDLLQFTVYGKTYYLIIYELGAGIKFLSEGVMIVAIENGKLNTDVRMIRTATGLHSELNVFSEGFSNNSGPTAAMAITFDPKTKTITLPLINENNLVTSKHITYKFTGKYFEKVKP